MKKYIHEDTTYQEVLERLDRVKAEMTPKWGKMNPAQMLRHCAEAQDVMNGDKALKVPFYIKMFKGFIKKMVLSEKPYKEGIPTAGQYKIDSNEDFETQKQRFIQALEKFRSQSSEEVEKHVHAMFGKMTKEEKSWATYKHLDHHLKQFGV